MKIYGINNFNFTAKAPLNKVNRTNSIPQEINKNCSEKLYGEIDKYLANKCSTAEYLNNFKHYYNELSSKGKLTPAEKKYADEMIVTFDLAEDLDNIPRNYLTERMLKLLEQRK